MRLKQQYRLALENLNYHSLLIALISSLVVICSIYAVNVHYDQRQARQALLEHYNYTFKEIDFSFQLLKSKFKENDQLSLNCQPAQLEQLRAIHFEVPFISEVALVDQSGYLVCNSWGQLAERQRSMKPILSPELRFFGPLLVDIADKYALIIAKTRGDGSEIHAQVPINVLKNKLEAASNNHDMLAVVDTHSGSPIFLHGRYSLPLAEPLFPLTAPLKQTYRHFDDAQQRFLIARAFPTLPALSLISTKPSSELYRDTYIVGWLEAYVYLLILLGAIYLSQTRFSKRASMKSRLKLALQHREFINHYQCIWDTQQDQLVAVECLVRWNHPVDGVRSPDSFLPEIDKSGLQVELTRQVLDNALHELQALMKLLPELKVNINITGQHLLSPEFIAEAIASSQQMSQMCLEITETELVEVDAPLVQQSLARLQQNGINLAIDDFGTGYAGLQYLQQLPLDTLKIDRSFVAAIHTDSPRAKVLDGVIELARSLQLAVVAEGVENREQADYLVERGVVVHQGWFYSKPTDINQLIN